MKSFCPRIESKSFSTGFKNIKENQVRFKIFFRLIISSPKRLSCQTKPVDQSFADRLISNPKRLMYRSIPKLPMPPPPPGQTPGHLTFLKNFGQIPRYVASLDGQMPHPFELQRGSNPPPSRHVKQTVETSSAKFSATTNFLFSLSSLHTLNKGIFHDRTI